MRKDFVITRRPTGPVNDADRLDYLAQGAKAAFKKNKRINIRISSRDLEAPQRRSLEDGLSYQALALVSGGPRKYVSGGFKGVSAFETVAETEARIADLWP